MGAGDRAAGVSGQALPPPTPALSGPQSLFCPSYEGCRENRARYLPRGHSRCRGSWLPPSELTPRQVVPQEVRHARPCQSPLPHPRTLDEDVSPGHALAEMSWEGDWQVAQACHGRSWLTHAGVVFESPKEGRRQRGIPMPGTCFLEWLDSSKSRGCPCPLSPLPTP